MATIFTTLFRNADSPNATDYQSFFLTLRDLFDYSVGNFNPLDMGNYNTSYAVMYIIHTVISNIFLMNYLIAIL
jgi:hypothetical protein